MSDISDKGQGHNDIMEPKTDGGVFGVAETMPDILLDIEKNNFAKRINFLSRDVGVLKEEYHSASKEDLLEIEKGKINYGAMLEELGVKTKKLESEYRDFVKLVEENVWSEQTKSADIAEVEDETVSAPPFPENILSDDFVEPKEPPAPNTIADETRPQIDFDFVNAAKSKEFKDYLEEKKAEFEKAKKKYDNRDSLMARAKKRISKTGFLQIETDFNSAKAVYDDARMQYFSLELFRIVEEKIKLAEAQTAEKIRSGKMIKDATQYITRGYTRFGGIIINNAKKAREQIAAPGRIRKLAFNLMPIRISLNLSLCFGKAALAESVEIGGLSAGAVIAFRRAFGNIGYTDLTSDILNTKTIIRRDEEKELEKATDFVVSQSDIESLWQMKTLIETRNFLDAAKSDKVKYKELNEKIDVKLKEILEADNKIAWKNAALWQFLSESDVAIETKIFRKIKKLEAENINLEESDVVFVTAEIISDIAEALDLNEKIKKELKWWTDSADIKLEQELADASVGKDESIVSAIERYLRAHPECVRHYVDESRPVQQILQDHSNDTDKLTNKDYERIARFVFRIDFGEHDLHADSANTVIIVFDENRFKLGTTEGSRVEDHLYFERITNGGASGVTEKKHFFGSLPAEAKAAGVEQLYKAVEENHVFDQTDYIVQDLKSEEKTDVPEVAVEVLKEAEKKYQEIWSGIVETMRQMLDPKKTVAAAWDGDVEQSKNFIAGVTSHIKNSAHLNKNNTALIAAFSVDSKMSTDQVRAAVEDNVYRVLPPEAEVLLAVPQAGDSALVVDSGSHAVKFFDTTVNKSMFVYHRDYIFFRGQNGEILAKKGENIYLAKPFLDKQNNLQVNLALKKNLE